MGKMGRIITPDLQRIIPVLAALMEVLWIYTWLAWVSSWPTFHWEDIPFNLVSSIALILAVMIAARLAYGREWSIKKIRITVLLCSFVVLLVLVRWNHNGGYGLFDRGWMQYAEANLSSLLTAFFFGLYLVWRGISVSRQRFAFGDIYRKFIIGLAGIIVLLVVWGVASGRSNLWPTVGIYATTYFGLGLLTLAIVNLESLRRELLHHKEAAGSFRRRWLSMLVVLILAIVFVSIAVGSVFSSNLVQRALHFLSRLGDWLLIALSYILLPLGYLLEGLIWLGRWIISLLRGDELQPQFNTPDFSDLQKLAEGQPPVHFPEALILALKWGGLAVILGLIIFFLARALVRYWEGKNEDEVEEVHEMLGSWKLFRKDLWSFFGWLFRWARRKKKTSSRVFQPPAPVIVGEKESDRIFNIRELYRAFLWQGSAMGIPRKSPETPYEYSRKMQSHLNMPGEEMDTLTEAYVADRYGRINPAPEKVSFLNRVWRRLYHRLTHPGGE